jgi:flagellar hook assembly protein FlgD
VTPAAAGVIAAEPNPFRGAPSVRFALPANGESFALSVYDVTGRLVRTVDRGTAAAGEHVRTWDGRDGGGNAVGAGVYLVRLTAGAESSTRKVVLLR